MPDWLDAIELALKHKAHVKEFGGLIEGRGRELFESLKKHDAGGCQGC